MVNKGKDWPTAGTANRNDSLDGVLADHLRLYADGQTQKVLRDRHDSVVKTVAVALTAALAAAEPRRLGRSDTGGLNEFVIASDAATDEQATIRKLRERLTQVLVRAYDEEFRDGFPSEFASDLRELVIDFGAAVVPELQRALAAYRTRPDVGLEALAVLASFDYRSIAKDRLRLIEWALFSPVPEIRYGAAFAIATLKDRATAQPLDAAIKREKIQRYGTR